MTKSGCQGEMPYAMTIVDEIVGVNMHQRLDLQCGRGLDYHAKRKIYHSLVRKIFFSLPDPKDNEIKGEINPVETTHKCHLHGLMGASIIEIIERVNVFFSEEHKKRMIDEWRTGCLCAPCVQVQQNYSTWECSYPSLYNMIYRIELIVLADPVSV